jgi:hypothetical protein
MVVLSLLAVLISLVIVSKVNTLKSASLISDTSFLPHPVCLVEISGAVARPGIYEIPIGASLKKGLQKSRPFSYADLSQIDFNKRIEASFHLHVPELSEMKIRVFLPDGEEIFLQVPLKTRVSDLKKEEVFSRVRSHKKLKSRRFLKAEVVIDLR